MPCKSILTYCDDAEWRPRLSAAAEVARAFDGHLTVAAFGYEPDIPPIVYGEGAATAIAEFTARATEQSEARAKEAAEAIEREGVRGEATPVVATRLDLARVFGRRARFADIVVVDQPYGPDGHHCAVEALEGALFDGDAAVLVMPKGGAKIAHDTIMIAWDGGQEALHAVRRARPFLERAKRIEITTIDPEPSNTPPGEELAVMLSRHGLTVEVDSQQAGPDGVSETLKRRAREVGADMLVMGAYGHSRFREYVLGGVTRDFLTELPLPALMAH